MISDVNKRVIVNTRSYYVINYISKIKFYGKYKITIFAQVLPI